MLKKSPWKVGCGSMTSAHGRAREHGRCLASKKTRITATYVNVTHRCTVPTEWGRTIMCHDKLITRPCKAWQKSKIRNPHPMSMEDHGQRALPLAPATRTATRAPIVGFLSIIRSLLLELPPPQSTRAFLHHRHGASRHRQP